MPRTLPPPPRHRQHRPPGTLPPVAVVRITGSDPDGDAIGRPLQWNDPGPPPMILMAPEKPGHPSLAPGQHVLAQLRPVGPGRYEGRTIRRIAEAPGRILGIFRPAPADSREAGRIRPTDRRAKAEWKVPHGETGDAQADEIVLAEPLAHDLLGLKPARVIERLGRIGDARAVSLIAIAANDIPRFFDADALAEAEAARTVSLEAREDLRALPLVTIDGADARDFDDAVFAEPDGASFRLVVAIADVAHYVRPDSALDRSARERGNSVYFPDRVVPMLPEALSNHWCSLRPGEDRGCLFAELRVAPDGRVVAHRFGRGLMRSAARLTYEQVQQARDGITRLPDLPAGLLNHFYDAFTALSAARVARGTLDLDLPERQVILHPNGRVADVRPRPRLPSHRLIEEFMIAANVAAAETLVRHRHPTLLRIHPPPDDRKIAELREELNGLDLSLPPGNVLHPRDLDRVLRLAAGRPDSQFVSELLLRAQAQASYSPNNSGHFGLALRNYAHFTSPIRRYADLVVHRGLIASLGLGPVGKADEGDLEGLGAHLTATERRAQAAEREAIDRYLASFLADKVGWTFRARVSGVTRFGVFVTLVENGANGIVPRSAVPDEWLPYEGHFRPRGRTSRGNRNSIIRLGQEVEVRLAEANSTTGGLAFQLMQGIPPRPLFRGSKPGKRPRRR